MMSVVSNIMGMMGGRQGMGMMGGRPAAGANKSVRNEDVVETLQAICAHHHPPVPHIVAA